MTVTPEYFLEALPPYTIDMEHELRHNRWRRIGRWDAKTRRVVK